MKGPGVPEIREFQMRITTKNPSGLGTAPETLRRELIIRGLWILFDVLHVLHVLLEQGLRSEVFQNT